MAEFTKIIKSDTLKRPSLITHSSNLLQSEITVSKDQQTTKRPMTAPNTTTLDKSAVFLLPLLCCEVWEALLPASAVACCMLSLLLTWLLKSSWVWCVATCRACRLAVTKIWIYIAGMTTVGITSNAVITIKAWTFFPVFLTVSELASVQKSGEKERYAGIIHETKIVPKSRLDVAYDW